MKLYIKNMVCQRCVAAVKSVFESENIFPAQIDLGQVIIDGKDLSPEKLTAIDEKLNGHGFERIDDNKTRIIEKIRNIIINQIHHQDRILNHNWSDIITSTLPYDYKYLSQLFSSIEGITIEQYIIRQKVEKAKELIIYDELNTSEIAYKLGYSSVSHFSNQFKKVTGMTPTDFKKLTNPGRKPLDKV